MPGDGGGRAPDGRPGLDTSTTTTPLPSETTTVVIVAQQPVADVVELVEARVRRLLAPWPGWWGDAEIRTWTWAERSRGRWSA